MDLNIGDKVTVLDDDLQGVIIHIFKDSITIETEDEFTLEFSKNQLLKIDHNERLLSDHSWHSSIKEDDYKKKSNAGKKRGDIKKSGTVLEIDLHIEKLLPTSKGMSNFDILDHQIDVARRQLEFAIQKKIQRIVFIHGVGEGKLKIELEYLLKRYDKVKFFDANYQKYGLGAMEVHLPNKTFRL
jgi:hypothetical protein